MKHLQVLKWWWDRKKIDVEKYAQFIVYVQIKNYIRQASYKKKGIKAICSI